jgi:hypothetical protein
LRFIVRSPARKPANRIQQFVLRLFIVRLLRQPSRLFVAAAARLIFLSSFSSSRHLWVNRIAACNAAAASSSCQAHAGSDRGKALTLDFLGQHGPRIILAEEVSRYSRRSKTELPSLTNGPPPGPMSALGGSGRAGSKEEGRVLVSGIFR